MMGGKNLNLDSFYDCIYMRVRLVFSAGFISISDNPFLNRLIFFVYYKMLKSIKY